MLLVAFVYDSLYTGHQYSVNPSPNITTLQSVVFSFSKEEIASSDTLSVHWIVNGTSTSSPSWQSYSTNYGIIAVDAGTQKSTLTIPGNPVLNGTVVQCFASGVADGKHYEYTTSDTLYIQGMKKLLELLCMLKFMYIKDLF